jgi:hypothetical protein
MGVFRGGIVIALHHSPAIAVAGEQKNHGQTSAY